ncbi:MAG: PD40 domain-containing protein, partial [Phycisphaeraceae bacterium]|nr:PD40 domain-containing protein [Phycisphaeraceae bacterium]
MKKTFSIVLVLALGISIEVAKADFTFGEPTNLGPTVNSSYREFNASISADGLSLLFISNRPGGVGGLDIWMTTRETLDEDWGEPVNLGPTINTPVGEWGVSISSDSLSLYFDTSQSGSVAIDDLWVATRATTDDNWGNPVSLGPTVNSSADDYSPSISADGLSLYFTSGRSGGSGNYDLWVTTRQTIHDPWGTPVNLGPTVNSSVFDLFPGISVDGLALFFTSFASDGSGGYGQTDIMVTTRATTNDDWGEPVNLGSTVNSSTWEDYPNVSADGSTLFFRSSQSALRSGGDIWQAPIMPVVDFNGDYKVDIEDLAILIEHWGQNEPSVDMAPMPWGDGVVDTNDLKVLMSYWGQEVYDPHSLALWKLDETEGDVAYDSAVENDAVVMGDALWHPEGGQIGGAIQLDGIDDYIDAPCVLDPADGPLS